MERSGLGPGKRVVVAVSGGPDSLALLHALAAAGDGLDLDLHGAHLNHGLRGCASNEDASFVRQIFRHLHLPLDVGREDVLSYRRQRRMSLEEAAREVRYAFLLRVALEQKADAIALGHTANDQAETVLMHIIRGTGLSGLRGMKLRTARSVEGVQVALLRPLLEVSRSETEAYCRALGLEPRQDESNRSLAMTRNRLREELVPLLEQYNPAIRDALLKLSRSAARDMDHMQRQTDSAWHRIVLQDDDGLSLNRERFSRLDQAVRRHLLRRVVLSVKGDLDDVEFNHIEDMARLMAGAAGRSLDLPGGVQFSVSYGEGRVALSRLDQCPLPRLEGETVVSVPGESAVSSWTVLTRVSKAAHPHLPPGRTGRDPEGPLGTSTEYFAFESMGEHLWVRSRVPGDRFQPLGMPQSKKLQDFMVDSKIPRSWRDRVPLLVSPRGIAWVVGWRIAEWAGVRMSTDRSLEISFHRRRDGWSPGPATLTSQGSDGDSG